MTLVLNHLLTGTPLFAEPLKSVTHLGFARSLSTGIVL